MSVSQQSQCPSLLQMWLISQSLKMKVIQTLIPRLYLYQTQTQNTLSPQTQRATGTKMSGMGTQTKSDFELHMQKSGEEGRGPSVVPRVEKVSLRIMNLESTLKATQNPIDARSVENGLFPM